MHQLLRSPFEALEERSESGRVTRRTVEREDETRSCISKPVKTFISPTPEPPAPGSTKSVLSKENPTKSLLQCVYVTFTENVRQGEIRGEVWGIGDQDGGRPYSACGEVEDGR